MSSVTGPVSVSFRAAPTHASWRSSRLSARFCRYGCQSSSQQITAPSGQKCQISVPTSLPPVGPEGGSGTLTITAARECAWTVASGAAWITIPGNRTGQGSGTVNYTAAGNPTPAARRGTLNVDDQQIELLQEAAPCQFTFTPPALAVESPGGENVVTVGTIDGCAWTAVSESNWIEVVGSAERSGTGQVQIRIQANPGPARTGQLRIAGQIYSLTQGSTTPSACAPAVASPERTAPAGGTTLSVAVTAPGGCVWSATSHASWITVTEGATGTGNGNVALVAAANTGPQRVGLVTVANVTVMVTQAAGTPAPEPTCSYALGSTGQSVPAAGGGVTVAVTTTTACAWTATTQVPWITIIGGAAGSGNGTVALTTAANTGAERTGTVSIAGQVFTVRQAAASPPRRRPAPMR